MADWLKDARKRLDEIGALPVGWLEPGDKAPDASVCARAWAVLEAIAGAHLPEPEIVPSPSNSIQIRWGAEDADLQVYDSGEITASVAVWRHKHGEPWLSCWDVTPPTTEGIREALRLIHAFLEDGAAGFIAAGGTLEP